MKRGFKAQCERRSVEVRKQLGFAECAPLNAITLAEHLQVDVQNALDIPGVSSQDQTQLTKTDPDSWSAFTVKVKDRHLIVYNPAQSSRRINSVIMHELSHITLGHELADGHISAHGLFFGSHYDQEQEHEADWLAGALLLPRLALLKIRENTWDNNTACDHYQTSSEMLIWRFRMTGVDVQLGYSKRRVTT